MGNVDAPFPQKFFWSLVVSHIGSFGDVTLMCICIFGEGCVCERERERDRDRERESLVYFYFNDSPPTIGFVLGVIGHLFV